MAGGRGTDSAPREEGTTQIPTTSRAERVASPCKDPEPVIPTPAFCNHGEGAPSVRLSRLLNENRPDLTQGVSLRISSKQPRCLKIAGVTEALITVITH